jgi:hypothetical protein
LPATAALLILIIGPRMRRPTDVILQCWFVATLVAMMLPKLPFRIHLIDGLAVVTALLLVRQLSTSPFPDWGLRRRGLALAIGGAVAFVSLTIQIVDRYITFKTGNRFDGAVARDEEMLTVNWLRQHARPEELVLAPLDSAGWIATVPVHSFASHWLASLDYSAQNELAEAFYAGKMQAGETDVFLKRYGINYVAVPDTSAVGQVLDQRHEVARIRTWTLYYFPENHMALYPGILPNVPIR